jgi:hypothetical protein
MDAHWVNNRPGYRCRHGHSSARSSDATRPKNLYIREDHALARLTQLRNGLDRGRPTPEDHAHRLRSEQLVLMTNGDCWSIEPANEQDPQTAEARPKQMRMSFMG